MATLLVTYDLNSPGQNHAKILETIKNYNKWARLSESSYAISGAITPNGVFEKLKPHLDKNDQLYVINLTNPWMGRGPEDVNDWLDNNLP